MLSNFKRWMLDIFHGVSAAHLQAYLDEFCYRLNRRDQRPDLFRRILNRCLLYTRACDICPAYEPPERKGWSCCSQSPAPSTVTELLHSPGVITGTNLALPDI